MSESNGAITFESLTGLELRAIKEAIGRPLAVAAQEGDTDVAYALEWIRQRRLDASVTFETVLALEIGAVMHHLDTVDDEDPTIAASGSPSRHSVTSGG